MQKLMGKIYNVQKALPPIQKEKPNEKAPYKYVNLERIHQVLNPLLEQNRLLVVQPLGKAENGAVTINTIIYDLDSGEKLESSFELPRAGMQRVNEVQDIGAAITYGRRYSLVSLFRIDGVDEDTDGVPQQQYYQKTGQVDIGRLRDTASILVNTSSWSQEKKSNLCQRIPNMDANALDALCRSASQSGGRV